MTDPMAEDGLGNIIHAELVRISDMYPADSSEIRWSLQEISKAINAYTTNKIIEAKHQVLDDLLSWWAYEQRNIEQNKVNATYNEIVLDKFDWLHAVKAMNAMKDPQKPFNELRKTL